MFVFRMCSTSSWNSLGSSSSFFPFKQFSPANVTLPGSMFEESLQHHSRTGPLEFALGVLAQRKASSSQVGSQRKEITWKQANRTRRSQLLMVCGFCGPAHSGAGPLLAALAVCGVRAVSSDGWQLSTPVRRAISQLDRSHQRTERQAIPQPDCSHQRTKKAGTRYKQAGAVTKDKMWAAGRM